MGSVGQAKGIIQALDKERYEIVEKKIDYNRLANLPNFLLGKSLLGVTAATRKELRAPWPDLAVSISRRTVPAARFIKKASGGMTKLIQLMHPGKSGLKDFSLAAVPEHDRGKTSAPNIFYITGCPHRVTPEALAEAAGKWSETFASLPRPLTAVIVGGAIKNKPFTTENARRLGETIRKIKEQTGGSILITTSRRTGAEAENIIKKKLREFRLTLTGGARRKTIRLWASGLWPTTLSPPETQFPCPVNAADPASRCCCLPAKGG